MRDVAGRGGLRGALSDRRALLRLAAAAVVVIAAVVVALLLTRGAPAPSGSTPVSAHDWTLPRLDRPGQLTLSSFRGRPLVLDFFASWCTSCESELPELAALSQQYAGRVAFAGVDSEETSDGLAMAERTGIGSWPLARDVGGRELSGLRDALEATPGMPITAYYDADGRLLHVQLGAESGDDVGRQITTLFHLPRA
ncbi:MAG: TlpA family protein disulfide reductase [Candidatus Dormibacteria bacterium]